MTAGFLRAAFLTLLVFEGTGCAWWQEHRGTKMRAASDRALAEAQAQPQRIGKIILVNEDAHFVLIDAEQWSARGEVKLESRAHGTKTGELRTSEVQKRPFVVADIVRGDPAKDDDVWESATGHPAPTPKATPINPERPIPPVTPLPWWRRTLLRVGLLR